LKHCTESVALWLALFSRGQLFFRQKIDAFCRELFALSIFSLMENGVQTVIGRFFSFGGLQWHLFPRLRVSTAFFLSSLRPPAVSGHLSAYVGVLVRPNH
jgi:hypothetical protein